MTFSRLIVILLSIVMFLNMQCDEDDELLVSSCDTIVIIDSNFYQDSESDFYNLVNVSIDGDCLSIEISSSGCSGETWMLELVDTNSILESYPIQRNLKLILTNNESCLAVFTKVHSFDLTPLRVDGENEMLLNIDGFPEPVLYSY